jgi:hypothetical protein
VSVLITCIADEILINILAYEEARAELETLPGTPGCSTKTEGRKVKVKFGTLLKDQLMGV